MEFELKLQFMFKTEIQDNFRSELKCGFQFLFLSFVLSLLKILLALVFAVVSTRRFCKVQTTGNYSLIDMLLYTCP